MKIDGRETELDEEGYLSEGLLGNRGEHVIEIGNRIRRRAIVVPGRVHPDCQPWPSAGGSRVGFALPEGEWFVVGSEPGEFLSTSIPTGGATVCPNFGASWAIRVGAGVGATAIHLHDNVSGGHEVQSAIESRTDHDGRGGRGSRSGGFAEGRWAETIYQANIRRPMLGCGFGCSGTEVAMAWRESAKWARRWKRQMKR